MHIDQTHNPCHCIGGIKSKTIYNNLRQDKTACFEFYLKNDKHDFAKLGQVRKLSVIIATENFCKIFVYVVYCRVFNQIQWIMIETVQVIVQFFSIICIDLQRETSYGLRGSCLQK